MLHENGVKAMRRSLLLESLKALKHSRHSFGLARWVIFNSWGSFIVFFFFFSFCTCYPDTWAVLSAGKELAVSRRFLH